MDIDDLIKKANERLKKAKLGVAIERRSESLCLRATLPPRPGAPGGKRQQRVALDRCKATPAGVQYAEKQAKILSGQLLEGTFNWVEWLDSSQPEATETIDELVQRFEADHWNKCERTQRSETTWNTDYHAVFSRLPKNEPVTVDMLVSVILEATKPDSRSRKRFCEKLYKLAEFKGLNGAEVILTYKGTYSAKEVSPRALPSDDDIKSRREQIRSPGWRWVYGILAAYGLRGHEVFRIDISEFPTVWVPDNTKTGERFVFPLYPEWVSQWNLKEIVLPNLQNIDAASNEKLSTKVSGFFYENDLPFTALDLRHCYSRRCFEFGFAPELGAKLMGHSVAVHTETYQAWISQDTYQRIYDDRINRPDRPQAP